MEDDRIGDLSLEQKELITGLKQDNQRMLKILSELLNMAQVESGKIQLNIQSVAPELIVEAALHTVAAAVKERGLHIDKVIAEDLPMINVDAEKTTWVLNNFFTNAIKYSQEGGDIEVSISQKDNHILFSVKDSGHGIARNTSTNYLKGIFRFRVLRQKAQG